MRSIFRCQQILFFVTLQKMRVTRVRYRHALRAVMCSLLAVLFLVDCTGIHRDGRMASNRQNNPFSMPAEAYLAMAKRQTGDEEQSLMIMAAGRLLFEGKSQEARRILNQMKPSNAIQQDEKHILLAKADVVAERHGAAKATLAKVHDVRALPVFYQAQYYENLALTYEAAGNSSYAIAERIKLEPLLPDEGSRMNNRRILWLALTKVPTPELQEMSLETDSPLLKGWTELALIPRQHEANKEALLAGIANWRQNYPHHPATLLLPNSLESVAPLLHPTPRRVALLLPVTGKYAGPGQAVRDGFVAAFHAHQRVAPDVKIYDTASADAGRLYQQAINNGAEYVVGPLLKNDVAEVAAMHHPVPTLLLNDSETRLKDNAYWFGLSPSNEARQVAVKASKKGLQRALVIAPSGAWGDEVASAFNEQWRKSGGVVVDRLTVDDKTDLPDAVRDFLHVSEQQAREKQYHQTDEQPREAKRREDFDMIFLLAYPSKARQIVPLLKYYFAGDIPVYATSSVYGGEMNTMGDRDLDGVIFCDMPWVFQAQAVGKKWPEQWNSYNRLYALGMDSYALSTQLNQLLLFPAMGVNDKSGVLYLNRQQQVARVLAWGQFRNGVAHYLGETVS